MSAPVIYPEVNGKILALQETDLLSGNLALLTQSTKVSADMVTFKGGKIKADTWRQILAFFHWSYGLSGGESQVRLFYNSALKEWRVVVAPQWKSTGLTTNEIADDPDRAEAFRSVEEAGFFEFGTVHHHCSASAFQSGTDHGDERRRNGLHITVGHLNQDVLDLDGRFVFRGVVYPGITDWAAWFEEPGTLTQPAKDTVFPEEWKTRLKDRPQQAYHGMGFCGGYGGGYGGGYEFGEWGGGWWEDDAPRQFHGRKRRGRGKSDSDPKPAEPESQRMDPAFVNLAFAMSRMLDERPFKILFDNLFDGTANEEHNTKISDVALLSMCNELLIALDGLGFKGTRAEDAMRRLTLTRCLRPSSVLMLLGIALRLVENRSLGPTMRFMSFETARNEALRGMNALGLMDAIRRQQDSNKSEKEKAS